MLRVARHRIDQVRGDAVVLLAAERTTSVGAEEEPAVGAKQDGGISAQGRERGGMKIGVHIRKAELL
jgi:hypothetical protein